MSERVRRPKLLPFICEQQLVSGWERCKEQCGFCRSAAATRKEQASRDSRPTPRTSP